jgi:transcription antitermination factor NusG
MNDVKKWYAVYTKPRWEKKVTSLLNKVNIISYCPLNRVVRQWSDRKKVVLEPLFYSYVFVQISEAEKVSVRQIDGVINFVCYLGKPAIIKEAEIEVIQQFLNEHKNVQLEKINVNVNDIVRIISGPLMEQKGSVVLVKGNKVKITLPSLGYIMFAEIEKSNVEIINNTDGKLIPVIDCL